VLVKSQGSANNEARFVYDIRVDDLHGAKSDAEIRAAILNIVEPIAGNVTIEKYAPVTDVKGHVVAYEATILR